MYKLIGKDFIERLFDRAIIPKIDGNVEYEQYKQWLNIKGNIPKPEFTEEELQVQELAKQMYEADSYLKETDWIEIYKLRHDLDLEAIPENSSKWEVIAKRAEYIEFLKNIER